MLHATRQRCESQVTSSPNHLPSAGALPHGAPPLPPPPLFPGCHVFVNHRYKFIYVRHPKAASTSLLSFFGKCVNGSSPYNSTCIEPLFVSGAGAGALPLAWC